MENLYTGIKNNDMNPNRRPDVLKGIIIILMMVTGCGPQAQKRYGTIDAKNPFATVGAIPPPPGYHRVQTGDGFSEWLRKLPLKADRTVHLYNGSLKRNQDAQYAVLDISVPPKDLQQCADAIMRLRAEYLYSNNRFDAIDFYTQQGVRLNFGEWQQGKRFRLTGHQLTSYQTATCPDRACFDAYLETVFSYCGTLSLEKQLIPASDYIPGNVLIKGGSPGHAMLVIDLAEDNAGHQVYMLAQSYMPAQDIHIVKNPSIMGDSPWYPAGPSKINTPEWSFNVSQLRRWKSINN